MRASGPNREALSLRARKRAAAKAHVADVAIALFAERGYTTVSVAEICAAAEIAPRSFFRYFATKEDVLVEPMRELASGVEAAVAAAPPDEPDDEVLERELRRLAEQIVADWDRLSVCFKVVRETPAVRASPLLQLADCEQALADQLVRRRGGETPADWRTRLRVARAVAAFRVWLDELRTRAVPDPLAHLDTILAAR